MRKTGIKKCVLVLTAAIGLSAALAGCAKNEITENAPERNLEVSSEMEPVLTKSAAVRNLVTSSAPRLTNVSAEGETQAVSAGKLEVKFGDRGTSFTMQLEDNDTARAIAKYVGTANWRLPIYHYDDYDNWEKMQYYDIPRRYEIPSGAKTVTSEKAGEVYYSDPNRIILFYEDAEITGEYTKIGQIEATDDFKDAVKNNPVVRGWSNKMVLINSIK